MVAFERENIPGRSENQGLCDALGEGDLPDESEWKSADKPG